MAALVLIPAYKPGADFSRFVSELIRLGCERIVVVDDGSGAAYSEQFEQASRNSAVLVLRHARNLGKGAALKTGMKTILGDCPGATVVVTADADGQHHPEDVMSVARLGEQHTGSLILGVRSFGETVPLRSRFGNQITRLILRVVMGQKLSDTQTGLRAIPCSLLPFLLCLRSQGYEFELDMLLLCRPRCVPIIQEPIRTIYLDGNASSHFRPLMDSMRIYFVLLRFAMASMCAAILDNMAFGALYFATGSIGGSMVAGRVVSALFNFAMVKRVVFNSRGRAWRELGKYTVLMAVSGALSFGLIKMFVARLSIGVIHSKLLAESILFFVNFVAQRDIVFTDRKGADSITE
jgi:glycosyltransferase involved in cell wall biosynthesis